MKHFLYYWKPDTVEGFAPNQGMNHIGGQFLRNATPGDVVWAVSIRNRRLVLVLRIPVGEVVSREVALARTGEEDLWNSGYHVLSPGLVKVPVSHIDIMSLALQLRFDGDPDRLSEGFDGRNLQQMRKLLPESVQLLETAWGRSPRPERRFVASVEDIQSSIANFNQEAIGHQERARKLLRETSYWVYEPTYERFGPGKFVGFAAMTFADYEQGDSLPGARFDGHQTRLAIEEVLDSAFEEREDLISKLLSWAERLLGTDAFGGADQSKWRFAQLERPTPLSDDAEAFPEGAASYVRHLTRERSQELRDRKKALALERDGVLRCEVCGFVFAKIYGRVGVGFIECHHTIPVSELKPGHKTKLEDVVLLCSNCHRMVHRKRPWLTVARLSDLIGA